MKPLFKRVTLPLYDVIYENEKVFSLIFKMNLKVIPGQFAMIGIFGEGEKPFSFSIREKGKIGFTIKEVGPFTNRLKNLKKGDLLSLRGPLGKPFSLRKGEIIVIGGGIGIPPLLFLLETIKKRRSKSKVTFVAGFKSKEELFFYERLKKSADNLIVTTEDGSFGFKGTPIDLISSKFFQLEEYEYVYGCGPEVMLSRLLELLPPCVQGEFLIERYIKCGIGLCGSCVIDPQGLRVCRDGPVFSIDTLRQSLSFGKYFRDGAGRRVIL